MGHPKSTERSRLFGQGSLWVTTPRDCGEAHVDAALAELKRTEDDPEAILELSNWAVTGDVLGDAWLLFGS